jgi:hypothetical protein
LGNDWQLKRVIVKLFEALETIRHALACSLIDLIWVNMIEGKKIVAFVKNEGSNFNVMSSALKFVIN